MKPNRLKQSGKFNPVVYECGASLLEGIAYLGIAALVILGAVSLLTGAFSSAQTNRGAEEVVSIRTGVKKLYMGQSAAYSTGSMNANLISAKVFPSSLAADATTNAVTNAWNGAVDVTGNGTTFSISYAAVPKDVCINLVSSAAGWNSVAVNGASALATPIPPGSAVTACNASSNSIVWTAS